MAKVSSQFTCQECGAVFTKWVGQCDACKAWNSVVEEVVRVSEARNNEKIPDCLFVSLGDDFDEDSSPSERHKTDLEEFNRVLGGGFVEGSIVLLSGPPGIGKSTLLLQVLSFISGIDNYIYVSAEESVNQVLLRARRLGIKNEKVRISNTNSIDQIISVISGLKGNSVVIVDSIQTVETNLIHSPPGTLSQVRFCTQELINAAKKSGAIVIIVGHVTKDGMIAGPKTLEHMVDCVLYFEGDRSYDYRILRGSKNRYGPTDEIGVFTMTSTGLSEVSNPSAIFLGDDENGSDVSGSAVFAGIEGTRPILSEIQALVSITNVAIPRRSSNGFDSNRLSMLVAVLSNRCRLSFPNKDVYLNVAGGLKICEPGVDLAIIAAIISSYYQRPLPARAVFFGEVSLSGDIRQVHLPFNRLKEAKKLGFTEVFCPYKSDLGDAVEGIKIVRLKTIRNLSDIIKRFQRQSCDEKI